MMEVLKMFLKLYLTYPICEVCTGRQREAADASLCLLKKLGFCVILSSNLLFTSAMTEIIKLSDSKVAWPLIECEC